MFFNDLNKEEHKEFLKCLPKYRVCTGFKKEREVWEKYPNIYRSGYEGKGSCTIVVQQKPQLIKAIKDRELGNNWLFVRMCQSFTAYDLPAEIRPRYVIAPSHHICVLKYGIRGKDYYRLDEKDLGVYKSKPLKHSTHGTCVPKDTLTLTDKEYILDSDLINGELVTIDERFIVKEPTPFVHTFNAGLLVCHEQTEYQGVRYHLKQGL